jgi:hypothetical protein
MTIVDPALQNQYAQLHRTTTYGAGADRFLLHIQACVSDLKPGRILDYGCGQSNLANDLVLETATFHRYDPAIPEIAMLPVTSADLIVNTDVMEHIPKSDVPDVLAHIRSISESVFFNIATRSARQILPDGRNAHLTVMTAEEWLTQIRCVFPSAEIVSEYPQHSCVITTWSSVLPVLAGIERLREKELQLQQYQDGYVRRIRRFAKSTVNYMLGQTSPAPLIYPATRRNAA